MVDEIGTLWEEEDNDSPIQDFGPETGTYDVNAEDSDPIIGLTEDFNGDFNDVLDDTGDWKDSGEDPLDTSLQS